MTKNNSTASVRHTIIWIGILVGLGFYVADILIDVFVFRSGSLYEEFLHPSYHETWMRATVFIVAIAFAIYVQVLLQRTHNISKRA